jgi:hypothetical protein
MQKVSGLRLRPFHLHRIMQEAGVFDKNERFSLGVLLRYLRQFAGLSD